MNLQLASGIVFFCSCACFLAACIIARVVWEKERKHRIQLKKDIQFLLDKKYGEET